MMEETALDFRTKTAIASFIALFGVLALTAYASAHRAEANPALGAAIFGQ